MQQLLVYVPEFGNLPVVFGFSRGAVVFHQSVGHQAGVECPPVAGMHRCYYSPGVVAVACVAFQMLKRAFPRHYLPYLPEPLLQPDVPCLVLRHVVGVGKETAVVGFLILSESPCLVTGVENMRAVARAHPYRARSLVLHDAVDGVELARGVAVHLGPGVSEVGGILYAHQPPVPRAHPQPVAAVNAQRIGIGHAVDFGQLVKHVCAAPHPQQSAVPCAYVEVLPVVALPYRLYAVVLGLPHLPVGTHKA